MLLDSYGRVLIAGAGSFDDGTADGGIRAHVVSSDLVKLPFLDGQYISDAVGGGYNRLQTGGQFATANSDGSGTVMMVVPANAVAANGGNGIWLPFYGTRFGVRFLVRSASGYSPGFTVNVDGVCYEVRHHTDPMIQAEIAASAVDWVEMTWMCPDILKDHKHIARIRVPGAMTTLYGNTVSYFTGIVVERRPGNGDPIVNRRAFPVAVGQLTAAFVAVPINGGSNQALNAKFVRRIDYYNTDTVARIVQIEAGSSVIWEAVLQPAGTQGSAAAYAPGNDMNLNGGTDPTYDAYYLHKADAASKVNYHVLAGV